MGDAGELTVLHVILSLEIGGMEQMMADLVRALDRERFRSLVVCLESLGPIADELQAEGVRVIKLAAMTPVVSFLYPAPLVALIREVRPDVIHVHSGCWYKAAMAGWITGVKRIIYTKHGMTIPTNAMIRMLDRIFSRLTTRIVPVSRELAEHLRQEGCVPPDRITVIINGIDLARFQQDMSGRRGPVPALRVGVVARLAPVKDVGTLLRAMGMVVAEHPAAVLMVVGDGPERELLQQLAVELGIGANVRFLGFRRDIPAVLDDIDIFALSSLSEGTSVSILEAMAAGKPVVATSVGGNPALIEHGVNGFLAPPANPEEIGRALLLLMRDHGLRERMGAAGRRIVEQDHGIRAMAARYENLYRGEG